MNLLSDLRQGATTKEISESLSWPQSSTSDLVGVLTEVGLLYKTHATRRYRPTALASCLGLGAQPDIVGSGALSRAMRALASDTGHSAVLVGKVGLDAQIYAWVRGASQRAVELRTGDQAPLHETAIGWLLLATLGQEVWPRVLRRLRAENAAAENFDVHGLSRRVHQCEVQRTICGPAGFVSRCTAWGLLVADEALGEPLVLAVLVPEACAPRVDLTAKLQQAFAAETNDLGVRPPPLGQ
jgi:DNA-binding IclR family transcriptional regulator